jgi:hypothetical protein
LSVTLVWAAGLVPPLAVEGILRAIAAAPVASTDCQQVLLAYSVLATLPQRAGAHSRYRTVERIQLGASLQIPESS